MTFIGRLTSIRRVINKLLMIDRCRDRITSLPGWISTKEKHWEVVTYGVRVRQSVFYPRKTANTRVCYLYSLMLWWKDLFKIPYHAEYALSSLDFMIFHTYSVDKETTETLKVKKRLNFKAHLNNNVEYKLNPDQLHLGTGQGFFQDVRNGLNIG